MRRICWILKFTCVLFHHFSLFLIGLIQQDKQNIPWYIVTMQEKWDGQKKLTTNQIVQDLVTWYTWFLLLQESYSGAKHKEIEVQKNLKEIQHVRSIFCFNDSCNVMLWNNPFWDSKPKSFSDICLPPKKRHTFKTSKNDDIQWIWSGGWEWWAVSGVIVRSSWFYLHIYAAKYVFFWILQRRLARHWGAGVIHAGSWRGYLKKNSRIELCMVHGW